MCADDLHVSSTQGLSEDISHRIPHLTVEPNAGYKRTSIERLAFPLAFLGIVATLVALFVGVLRINNHTFLYTLDDPYIHLALSDQIRHGNYGLYAGTHAAPSSSIIFPFLLAVTAGTPVHPYFPLLINVVALFFTAEIMRRFLLHLRLGTDDFALAAQAALLFLMALCFNLIGVVFTGLEHSLHIATVATIIYGLVLFIDCKKLPYWLPAAIVLCPLIRYEGLALSVGALLILALRGRVKIALATFAVIVVLLGGFSLFLIKLGLPPLPSSILSKSAVAAGGVDGTHSHMLSGIARNVDNMALHPTGLLMLLIGVVAGCICLSDFSFTPRRWTPRGLISLALLAMVGGQAVAGRFGWLERYEDYLIEGTALLCIYLAQSEIRRALAPSRKNRLLIVGAFTAALLIFGVRYWRETFIIPLASNNIYEQQLQMHNFVDKFYKGPVAINDLGLSSYHNPYPVLDLGGLGSEKARLLLASHALPADYAKFVGANDVHLVMIYEEWFHGSIPKDWQCVGMISLSRPSLFSAFQADVRFYVTDNTTATLVRAELASFRETLPNGVKLTIYSSDVPNK